MPRFERSGPDVAELAGELLRRFETHQPLLDANVTIDFVFAYADRDENDEPKNVALTKNGMQALGICRKISPKDRALGRGDAEIALDGDWWEDATEEERAALLDHELHHIAVIVGERDRQGRPKLALRKHDFEVGWFHLIAQRHGNASMERLQARRLMKGFGQLYWPEILDAAKKAGSDKQKVHA